MALGISIREGEYMPGIGKLSVKGQIIGLHAVSILLFNVAVTA